ncbi:MAG: M50 family metallopeptidase [Gemmatimonadetes bacterium]|uniref:M50 family metallopeptidase n=1 Tax=Candidatus Kutchimonas denitrificans TaxID=3056748 RepID=A0AAE5CCC0_9BACT|nr:M50 family metallopeptidase [Gemmatimonadota bacterium]NIR73979.1 M50 family metallopeptidase [Candidatus Kutchimonas denitrificans]NIS02968.1 M50 family metallopeptidase [Gemmatimonadota bacterium]NIT68685.1 M50 family metallopeptidase [Gemmatimonadota bacterium]NIU53266.1 M50 family peptidase [Gemmatimonadota bacterium]
MEDITKRRVRFLAGFAVYFVVLWVLWNTPFVYPIKIFVVLLHEVSHGVMALATGGAIERITISAAQGGMCQCSGGSPFLILSAGYLGSLLFGALILWPARGQGIVPRAAAATIGVVVVIATALWVRNAFGLMFGFGFGGLLIAAARQLPEQGNAMLLTVLGLTSCLYAILDIKSDILDRPNLPSDARMLAELTGIPTVVWGMLWIAAALLFILWLFRRGLARVAASPADEKEPFKV